jgi:hypothetical protein
MPINPLQAWTQLTTHPKTFLSHYPVRSFGANVPSGVEWCTIGVIGASRRPGEVLGTARWHATDLLRLDVEQNGIVPPNPNHRFQAHYVRMNQSNVDPIHLHRIDWSGPDLMVTGQLSGCSFCIRDAGGGDIEVAHLQPNGETAVQLHGRMLGRGFSAVYGANQYDGATRVTSIVGVRRQGRWKIYAQKQQRLGVIGDDYRVVSVTRIYEQP